MHEVGELVAAEPGHGVAGPHQAGEPLADHGQHQVAGAVPVPVVDHLEVVEVEQQQPERAVGPPYQRVLDAVHQQHPVRQPGERVVVGLPEQPGGQLVRSLTSCKVSTAPSRARSLSWPTACTSNQP